jgi:hypothetical protein
MKKKFEPDVAIAQVKACFLRKIYTRRNNFWTTSCKQYILYLSIKIKICLQSLVKNRFKTVCNKTLEADVTHALSLASFHKEEWTHYLLLTGHYFRRQSAVPTQNKEKRVFAKTFRNGKTISNWMSHSHKWWLTFFTRKTPRNANCEPFPISDIFYICQSKSKYACKV